jgi:ribosomal protein L11 methyltransferase
MQKCSNQLFSISLFGPPIPNRVGGFFSSIAMSKKLYLQYDIGNVTPSQVEMLIALLSMWGLQGFEETEDSLNASAEAGEVDEEEVDNYLQAGGFAYTKHLVEQQNWNAIWESGFEPVQVGNFAAVRASFHKPVQQVRHELVITPKMSFGTGHHATTYMMMQEMEALAVEGKRVFDFGTGTGVLAILAEKMGASAVFASDYDPLCMDNCSENLAANGCHRVVLMQSEFPPFAGCFDIILANINKDIILTNLPLLAQRLDKDGSLLLSGILKADEQDLKEAIARAGLAFGHTRQQGEWIAILAFKHLQGC